MKRIILGALMSVVPLLAFGQASNAVSATACADLIASYTKVSTALAHDDLKAAQDGSADLACWATHSGEAAFMADMEQFKSAGSIEAARTVFKAVSARVIPLAAKEGSHYVMTCPMAQADWIQTTADIANPYYGSSMLTCGSVKEKVSGPK